MRKRERNNGQSCPFCQRDTVTVYSLAYFGNTIQLQFTVLPVVALYIQIQFAVLPILAIQYSYSLQSCLLWHFIQIEFASLQSCHIRAIQYSYSAALPIFALQCSCSLQSCQFWHYSTVAVCSPAYLGTTSVTIRSLDYFGIVLQIQLQFCLFSHCNRFSLQPCLF